MSLTCLPQQVSQGLRVLEPCVHRRHQLVFSWLLVLHLLCGERANLNALARHGPEHLACQHDRRLVCAADWCTKTLRWWFADQALRAFPPSADGVLSLVGASTLKGQRGPKPPVAQNTRLSQQPPYVFGFRIVMLRAHWGVYCLPVACALIRRKREPGYETENTLCRQRLQAFRPPAWCQAVVVVAEAASASRANLTAIQERGDWDVMALPRTWKFTNGQARKALATHLPRWWSRQLRLPTVNGQRRRAFWVDAKRARRRYLGDVTVVLSTCRRTAGPKQTKILVTNLPATVTVREVVGVSRRRWWVERLFKESTGVIGLGQPQVTKRSGRVERSVAIAIMADLLLLKRRAQDIPADRPWSAFSLQRACAWEVIQAQCERSARQMARMWLQLGQAAS